MSSQSECEETTVITRSARVPSEAICYFWILQQVDQKINRVFSCQSTVTIYNNVEHKLESLVDVLCIKELV